MTVVHSEVSLSLILFEERDLNHIHVTSFHCPLVARLCEWVISHLVFPLGSSDIYILLWIQNSQVQKSHKMPENVPIKGQSVLQGKAFSNTAAGNLKGTSCLTDFRGTSARRRLGPEPRRTAHLHGGLSFPYPSRRLWRHHTWQLGHSGRYHQSASGKRDSRRGGLLEMWPIISLSLTQFLFLYHYSHLLFFVVCSAVLSPSGVPGDKSWNVFWHWFRHHSALSTEQDFIHCQLARTPLPSCLVPE